jgi:regulator of sigma E protease
MTDFAQYLFAFVFLLSVLIFVHELGHFLVAKACGVRVLKFSIGFGNPVRIGRFRALWRRGHTEYVIAWFPVGGFVKMLGENPDEQDDPEARAHPSETLGAKPLWQKLAIVFAGPAMNLVLPVLIFVAMQAAGLPRAEAVIGLVETGSPAEAAGILPGDRILALDGEPVRWWGDVAEKIAASPGRELAVELERAGAGVAATLRIEARPGFDDFGQTAEVGWAGLGHPRPSALLGVAERSSPAWQAGLRAGDRVTAVAGAPVEDWYGFAQAYAAEALALELPALGDLEALGVFRANAMVTGVEPGSPADRAGVRAGDLVVTLDGEPITFFDSFARAVATSEGRPMRLGLVRGGETLEVGLAAEPLSTDLGYGIEESRYRIGILGSNALVQGAIVTDQVLDPLVSLPRAVGMTVDFTVVFLQGLVKIVSGEVSTKSLAGPIGIAQMAGSAFQDGWDRFLRLMVLISINLGILNLLPIPVLDGGQAMLFLIEGIKRGPLSLRAKLAFQQLGITVIVLLMGLAFWNDLSRLWSKVVDWLPGGGM